MKKVLSVLLMVTVIVSTFAVSSISTSAASTISAGGTAEYVTLTQASMDKNGNVSIRWQMQPNCTYYRVFYKIGSAGWVKAADILQTSQGTYYPGKTMYRRITIPLSTIPAGQAENSVKIYVTVRGMDFKKNYVTSFKSNQIFSGNLQSFAPRLYFQSMESGKATFIIIDPPKIDASTKFRVYYWCGKWKAIGDFYKNNLANRFAVVTLNLSLYRYNNSIRFTVRGINSSGQFTTPFVTNAVTANDTNSFAFRIYQAFAR